MGHDVLLILLITGAWIRIKIHHAPRGVLVTWRLNDLSVATGATLPTSRPTGYAFDAEGTQHVTYVEPMGYVFAGTQHVNYLGIDNHIYELWWDNSGWHLNDLTAAVGAPPVTYAEPRGYAFEAHGTQHVIYRDDAKHVLELELDAIVGWALLRDASGTAGRKPRTPGRFQCSRSAVPRTGFGRTGHRHRR